jgi:hypothetical protein
LKDFNVESVNRRAETRSRRQTSNEGALHL